MYKFGYFRNLANELYKVVIITDYQEYKVGQQGQEEITLLYKPVSIEFEGGDDVFAPYRASTMTVRFLQERFDESLNNSLGNNVFVTLQKEEGGKYKTMWQGFSTPNAYNQPFINVVGDEFELECQDALSTLKYCYFEKQNTKNHLTIKDYIQLAFLQLNGLFKRCIYPTTPNNILEMCISQENWLNENDEPMSWLDILSEICKYLGLTLTSEGEDILLLDPHCDEYFAFSLESGQIQPITFIREEITLNKEDVSSNDCNISLLPSYNKVSLTAKHFPIEKKIQKYEDMELEHCSGYGERGQYGPSMICDSNGADSEHVQHFQVFNQQIGAFNVFMRYNHFNPYEDFTFYSHPKDENGNFTTKLPIANETVLNKDFLFSHHNVSAPCEYETQEIKKEEWNNVVKKVSLKKAFIFHTAFGNSQNKELVLDTSETKDWTAINQTIDQVLFSHRIAHVTTNNNPNGNIVNISFSFSCYWGSYMPCKKRQKNDYKELLYRLRFGDKYYNDKENTWQTKPFNCTVQYDDGGNLIVPNSNTDWKQSLIYGEHKGINVPLPTNQTGDVYFEFMRPFTAMRTDYKFVKGALFDSKIPIYTRTTEGCNLITDYEATIYGLSHSTDDSETQYENQLSDNKFIEEKSNIELKVCTYDGKATAYSSPYFYTQERGVEMLRSLDYGLFIGSPEENLITRAINQFQTPQLKMEITLNREIGFNSSITSSWFPDKKFIITSYTFEPQQINYTYSFVELKDISTFQPIVKKDKERKQKRNGDLIYHENNSPRQANHNFNLDVLNNIKPTNFTLDNNGNIIMTI